MENYSARYVRLADLDGCTKLIRCQFGQEMKPVTAFSKNSIKKLATRIVASPRRQILVDDAAISCQEHLGNACSAEEMKCEGPCNRVKHRSNFTKSALRHTQWCISCVQWKESIEPTIIPWAPPQHHISANESNTIHSQPYDPEQGFTWGLDSAAPTTPSAAGSLAPDAKYRYTNPMEGMGDLGSMLDNAPAVLGNRPGSSVTSSMVPGTPASNMSVPRASLHHRNAFRPATPSTPGSSNDSGGVALGGTGVSRLPPHMRRPSNAGAEHGPADIPGRDSGRPLSTPHPEQPVRGRSSVRIGSSFHDGYTTRDGSSAREGSSVRDGFSARDGSSARGGSSFHDVSSVSTATTFRQSRDERGAQSQRQFNAFAPDGSVEQRAFATYAASAVSAPSPAPQQRLQYDGDEDENEENEWLRAAAARPRQAAVQGRIGNARNSAWAKPKLQMSDKPLRNVEGFQFAPKAMYVPEIDEDESGDDI